MKENNQIRVWDLFVRVFHWSLVLFFVVAYATGDDKNSLHRYVGYAILALVAGRIFWGFVGTKHARFSDFMCSPVKAISYVKSLAVGKPTYYPGHNPAAAWMILFLLLGSLVVCLSGYAEGHGEGEKDDAEDDGVWGDIHEISAQCLLFLIFVHIVGVAASSRRHNENLVRAMITGKKTLHVS